jgi:plastin-1
VKSFKDSSMKDSFFFLELVSAIESSAVSWDYVKRPPTAEKATEGEKAPQLEEEDLLSNAKYVISCARKMGAMVFVTPEDIVEVKSKMLLTFVASLWATELDPDRATAVR